MNVFEWWLNIRLDSWISFSSNIWRNDFLNCTRNRVLILLRNCNLRWSCLWRWNCNLWWASYTSYISHKCIILGEWCRLYLVWLALIWSLLTWFSITTVLYHHIILFLSALLTAFLTPWISYLYLIEHVYVLWFILHSWWFWMDWLDVTAVRWLELVQDLIPRLLLNLILWNASRRGFTNIR